MTAPGSPGRRPTLAGPALGVCLTQVTGRTGAAQEVEGAGVTASPAERAWSSRVHEALKQRASSGEIGDGFSDNATNTDCPRVLRGYAPGWARRNVGERDGAERDACAVATAYPKAHFLMGSGAGRQGGNFSVLATRSFEAAVSDVIAGKPWGKDCGVFGMVDKGGNDGLFDRQLLPPAAGESMMSRRATVKSGGVEVPTSDAKPA